MYVVKQMRTIDELRAFVSHSGECDTQDDGDKCTCGLNSFLLGKKIFTPTFEINHHWSCKSFCPSGECNCDIENVKLEIQEFFGGLNHNS